MRAKARRSSGPAPLPLSAQIPHAILNVDCIPGPQRIAHGLHGGLEVVCVQGFEPSQVAHVGATEFGCRNPDGTDLNVVAVRIHHPGNLLAKVSSPGLMCAAPPL